MWKTIKMIVSPIALSVLFHQYARWSPYWSGNTLSAVSLTTLPVGIATIAAAGRPSLPAVILWFLRVEVTHDSAAQVSEDRGCHRIGTTASDCRLFSIEVEMLNENPATDNAMQLRTCLPLGQLRPCLVPG